MNCFVQLIFLAGLAARSEGIIAWTQSALVKNCSLIQFEPAWDFFNLPAGTFEFGDSNKVPAGTKPGEVKESLKKLIEFLLAAKNREAVTK
jgi:hypothetical protein